MNSRCFALGLFHLLASSASLLAADLVVAGMDNDVDASVLLHDWASGIGYSASLSETKKSVFIKDDLNYALMMKVSSSGVDRIVIYNTYEGKPSNVNSQELLAIVRNINLERNVCSAYIDKRGDLVLRYVLSFDDRISPKLFRIQLEHVKSSSEDIFDTFADRLAPYIK
jgi:hypothetical protein